MNTTNGTSVYFLTHCAESIYKVVIHMSILSGTFHPRKLKISLPLTLSYSTT